MSLVSDDAPCWCGFRSKSAPAWERRIDHRQIPVNQVLTSIHNASSSRAKTFLANATPRTFRVSLPLALKSMNKETTCCRGRGVGQRYTRNANGAISGGLPSGTQGEQPSPTRFSGLQVEPAPDPAGSTIAAAHPDQKPWVGDASVDLATQRTKQSVDIYCVTKGRRRWCCVNKIKTISVNLPEQVAAAFRPLIFPPAFHSSARLHDAIHGHDQVLRRCGLGDKGVSARYPGRRRYFVNAIKHNFDRGCNFPHS